MTKYLYRILAVAYVLLWTSTAASLVGKPTSPIPPVWAWDDVWAPIVLIVMAVWIGYQAGKEATP